MTEFLGVLGWPLDHTLSPTIHNAALRRLRFDWIYLAWPVPPEDLAAAVGGLRALGAMGANVTMPHKEAVVDLLDAVSGDARAIGAVNTIQRIGRRLVGHNTDVDGFAGFLVDDAGVAVDGMTVLVLGAGGAARAVVKALGDLGADAIAIAGREPDRAAALRPLGGDASLRVVAWPDLGAAARAADLIVNSTPLGSDGADPLSGYALDPRQIVVDLVYSPPQTPLVERARAAGCRAWGGLGMLVGQAAASFRIWTGQDPPTETMSAAAIHAIGSRR